jgi:hypothetical protein
MALIGRRPYSPCVVRTWVRALAGGFAAAVLIGAGQLGIAYSFGILRWDQPFEAGAENGWNIHLTWVAYIAMLAVVGGATAGVRPLRRADFDGLGAWMAVALAALAGAGIVVPLVALPAAAVEVPRPLDPALNVGLAAGLGAAVGFFAALAALYARALAASVFVVAGWAWLVALGSVVGSLDGPSPLTGLRLGVLSLPQLPEPETQNMVLPVMAATALLCAAGIAGYSRWLGEPRLTVVSGGLAGPALVASAYLIAGPGISATQDDQLVPWRAALLAVGAGLAASTLVALVPARRRPSADDRTRADENDDKNDDEPSDHARPGDDRPGHETEYDRTGDGGWSGETRTAAIPVSSPIFRAVPRQVAVPEEDYVDWVSGLGRD